MGLLALDSGGGATLPEIAVLDTKGVWPILVSHLPVTRGGHDDQREEENEDLAHDEELIEEQKICST